MICAHTVDDHLGRALPLAELGLRRNFSRPFLSTTYTYTISPVTTASPEPTLGVCDSLPGPILGCGGRSAVILVKLAVCACVFGVEREAGGRVARRPPEGFRVACQLHRSRVLQASSNAPNCRGLEGPCHANTAPAVPVVLALLLDCTALQDRARSPLLVTACLRGNGALAAG